MYDGAVHHCAASLAPDIPVFSLGGMSKTYRLAGFRSGWLVVCGPKAPIAEYLEGLELLANMRMCPNVPAQHAIPAALDGGIDITPLLAPGGRLRDQRDRAWELLTEIPGVDCYQPAGALYLFPRLDPEVHKIVDDQRMCIDLLEQQHVLLTHGTGFNLPSTDHIRVVFLAPVETLTEAIGRLGEFLGSGTASKLASAVAASGPREGQSPPESLPMRRPPFLLSALRRGQQAYGRSRMSDALVSSSRPAEPRTTTQAGERPARSPDRHRVWRGPAGGGAPVRLRELDPAEEARRGRHPLQPVPRSHDGRRRPGRREFLRLACLAYADDQPERWDEARRLLAPQSGDRDGQRLRGGGDRRYRRAAARARRRPRRGPAGRRPLPVGAAVLPRLRPA